ncbi:hypothetical protein MP228_003523 [Amoeboaphelidium protococcarum]|nr:hypothetical protein MP228_003523 [Amoeboaphelidium protococcarum]
MIEVIAAIDNGTTSSRVILFDKQCSIVASHQQEYPSIYQQPGWCEQDPNDIIKSINACIDQVQKSTSDKCKVVAIGITNQRETLCCWDKTTGEPLCNAIVWLDSRTSDLVDELVEDKGAGDKRKFVDICGLPFSTYFSAVKLKWLLKNDTNVQAAYNEHRLAVGTVDSWIIYNLTGKVNGGVHVTDVTNASRTMLMDLQTCEYSQTMMQVFDIDESVLPHIRSSSEVYGRVSGYGQWDGVVISGCLGDQQAAVVGQKCFQKGMAKNTYGTGCFMLMNTGPDRVPPPSESGLLTTLAYKLGKDAQVCYAYEGSIAISGAAVSWLRDSLEMVTTPQELSKLAGEVEDSGGVIFVPALSGLFAPYWKPNSRGCLFGLSQFTTRKHICRALLEGVAFQTREILEAMKADSNDHEFDLAVLRVDGGMSNSDVLMQIQADILGIPVQRPQMKESTALGAAIAAGLAIGFYEIDQLTSSDAASQQSMDIFSPKWSQKEREEKFTRWKRSIQLSIEWSH